MIQTYKQIKDFVNRFNNSTKGQYGLVQKLYSTPHLICIILRFKGENRFLFLGRGNHFEGVWEYSGPPPSEFRVRGRFLEYLRKHLIGARVGNLKFIDSDRILIIPYFHKKNKNLFSLFWKGRTLYFLNIYLENEVYRIFPSWIGKEEIYGKIPNEDDILEIFRPLGIGQVDLEKEGPHVTLDEYFFKLNQNLKKSNLSSKKIKFFERKEEKIQKDLEKLKKVQKIKNFLNDPNYSFADKNEIKFEGIKFKFDKSWSEYKKKGKIFEKLKDFKKGESLLEKRLQESKNERIAFEKEGENSGISGIKIIEPFWELKKDIGKPKSDFNIDFFETKDGFKIAIGKDVKANDFLRSKWAAKEDYWFHLQGHKSGHLFLKGSLSFNENLFSQIGSLIRDYSKLEILEIPLIYTQVKYLKGLKGKSGSVTYTREKHLRVYYNKNWTEFIFKI